MGILNINGVQLDFNLYDADLVERYENANDKVIEMMGTIRISRVSTSMKISVSSARLLMNFLTACLERGQLRRCLMEKLI